MLLGAALGLVVVGPCGARLASMAGYVHVQQLVRAHHTWCMPADSHRQIRPYTHYNA